MQILRAIICVVFTSVGANQAVLAQAAPISTVKASPKVPLKHSDKKAKQNIDSAMLPDVTLKVQPQRCVTLRRGQRCYLKLKMDWSSSEPINVCFFSDSHEVRACWENAVQGEFRKEVYLLDSTEWVLQDAMGRRFGDVTVEVSSSYNRRRRGWRGWRLF